MRTWLKLSKVGWLAVLGLALVMVTASAASATTITINNPSFEAQQPTDGGWSTSSGGNFTTSPTLVTDWTYGLDSGAPSGATVLVGLLHPTNTYWMNSVPAGANVVRVNGYSYMTQILTTNLAANTQYTLTVDIGARKDTPTKCLSVINLTFTK